MARKPNFENSAADKRMDRAGAKKAGKTLKQWEGSPADMKADAKAQRQMYGKGRRGR